MRPFSEAHRAVHFPPDRRFFIWIRSKGSRYCPSCSATDRYCLDSILVVRPAERLDQRTPRFVGRTARISGVDPANAFRKLFLPDAAGTMLLARSGLSILMDHPGYTGTGIAHLRPSGFDSLRSRCLSIECGPRKMTRAISRHCSLFPATGTRSELRALGTS